MDKQSASRLQDLINQYVKSKKLHCLDGVEASRLLREKEERWNFSLSSKEGNIAHIDYFPKTNTVRITAYDSENGAKKLCQDLEEYLRKTITTI